MSVPSFRVKKLQGANQSSFQDNPGLKITKDEFSFGV